MTLQMLKPFKQMIIEEISLVLGLVEIYISSMLDKRSFVMKHSKEDLLLNLTTKQ